MRGQKALTRATAIFLAIYLCVIPKQMELHDKACRIHRAEIGHHHHIAGQYLLRYAQEATRQ